MLPSIFVLAPTLILILGAAVIIIMRLFRSTIGFTWIVAAVSALVAWGVALFTRFRLPMEVELPGWQSVSLSLNTISFTVDRLSWPLEMALVTLVLGVIFTDSARYAHLARPDAWAGSLAVIALGIFSALSSQPLPLILGWTAIDIVESLLLMDSANNAQTVRQIIVSLGYKFAGTILVLGAILANPILVEGSTGVSLTAAASLILLIGISLRLGALPLHPPFYRELPVRRGLGTVLRLAPAASTLVFLARFTPDRLIWGSVPGMLILLAVSALYSAWMWLRAEDELAGRPFWIIALSCFAVTCSLRGHNEGVIAWGAALILSGGILFLYSAREKHLIFLPVLGLIGFSGLPYTPAASAWEGLVGPPLPGLTALYILSLSLLLVGYLRKAFQPGDTLKTMERWVALVYPLGLIALAATFVVMGIAGWPGSRTVGVWWAGFAAVAIAAVGIIVHNRQLLPAFPPWATTGLVADSWSGIKAWTQRFLDFSWLNRLSLAAYRLLALLVSRIAFLLEGDAGVLWTMVLLALFLTVLNVGGQP